MSTPQPYDGLFVKARNMVTANGTWRELLKDGDSIRRFQVDFDKLPAQFPTHLHPAGFWEALGRVVATFGFLEETLGKAIFSFTATRQYPETEIQAAYERWLPTLQRALSDPTGRPHRQLWKSSTRKSESHNQQPRRTH